MAALNHIHTLTASSFPFSVTLDQPTQLMGHQPFVGDPRLIDEDQLGEKEDEVVEQESLDRGSVANSTLALMTMFLLMEQLKREPKATELHAEHGMASSGSRRLVSSRPRYSFSLQQQMRGGSGRGRARRRRRRRRRGQRRRRLREPSWKCDKEKKKRLGIAVASSDELKGAGVELDQRVEQLNFEQQLPKRASTLSMPEVSNFYENYNYKAQLQPDANLRRRHYVQSEEWLGDNHIDEHEHHRGLHTQLGDEAGSFGQRLDKHEKVDTTTKTTSSSTRSTWTTSHLANMRGRTLRELRAVAATIRGLDSRIRWLKKDASAAQERREVERRRRLLNLVQLQSLANLMENKELENYFVNSHHVSSTTRARTEALRHKNARLFREQRRARLHGEVHGHHRVPRSPTSSNSETRQLSPLLDKLLSKHEEFLSGGLDFDETEADLDVSPTSIMEPSIPEVVEVSKGVQIVKLKKVFPVAKPISEADVRPLSGVVAHKDVTPILVNFLEDEFKLTASYQATTPVSPHTLFTTPRTTSIFWEKSTTPKPISHILDPFATNTQTTTTSTTTTSTETTTSETAMVYKVPLLGPLLQSMSSSSSSTSAVQSGDGSGLELVGVAVGGVALAAAALFMGFEMTVPALFLASRRSDPSSTPSFAVRQEKPHRGQGGRRGQGGGRGQGGRRGQGGGRGHRGRTTSTSDLLPKDIYTVVPLEKPGNRFDNDHHDDDDQDYDYYYYYDTQVGLRKPELSDLSMAKGRSKLSSSSKSYVVEPYLSSVPEELPTYLLKLEERRQAQILRQQMANRNQRFNYAYLKGQKK